MKFLVLVILASAAVLLFFTLRKLARVLQAGSQSAPGEFPQNASGESSAGATHRADDCDRSTSDHSEQSASDQSATEIDLGRIVRCCVQARKHGVNLDYEALVRHERAGGRTEEIVWVMLEAKQAGVDLSWEEASAYDLAGHDPEEIIRLVRSHRGGDGSPNGTRRF